MSNGSGGPKPWHGVKVEYENVRFSADDETQRIELVINTGKDLVGVQIDMTTGQVIDGSNAPKEQPKD